MRVTTETKAATRQRILEVAQELFAEKGFGATTTRDIAQAAGIAIGTLFNYFPTKEAIVACLVNDRFVGGQQEFQEREAETASLEEQIFAYVAAVLRKLKPLRTHLPALLDTALCPLVSARNSEETDSLRVPHLETVRHLVAEHGLADWLSPAAIQLYWTLYTGVLAFWANDKSPKQEDTLALLDQSIEMFVGWLRSQRRSSKSELQSKPKRKSKPPAGTGAIMPRRFQLDLQGGIDLRMGTP